MTVATEDRAWPGLSAEALYWSERGEVACGRHTPYPGSDTWAWDGWREMTAADRAGWNREAGNAPVCETCAARGRRGR